MEEIFRGSIIFLWHTYLCLSIISFFNIYIFIEWIHDLFLIFVESFSSVFAFLFYFISFLLVFFYWERKRLVRKSSEVRNSVQRAFFLAFAITNVSSWRSCFLLESFVAVWKSEITGKVFFFLFANSFGYLRLHGVNSSSSSMFLLKCEEKEK